MPLIEEVVPGPKRKPPFSSSTTSNSTSNASLMSGNDFQTSLGSSLPPSIINNLLNINKSSPTNPTTANTENIPPTKEQMKMAFTALAELEKTDQAAFEEIMTKLETEMEKAAVEQGIDLDERKVEIDEAIQSGKVDAYGFPVKQNHSPVESGLKMPNGSSIKAPDGPKTGKPSTEGGVLVDPTPGFTIKTYDMTVSSQSPPSNPNSANEEGRKVFVNVCSSASVGPPKTVQRLNAEGESVEGLSVPVAVGSARFGGKGGENSLTFDVIVNPGVIEEARTDETGGYRDFLCQLVMEYVEQKSKKKIKDGGLGPDDAESNLEFQGIRLDKRYKLPKLKYHCYVDDKGKPVSMDDLTTKNEVAKQWIREQGKGEKGISEVAKDGGMKAAAAEANKATKTTKKAEKIQIPTSLRKAAMEILITDTNGDTTPFTTCPHLKKEDFESSSLPSPNPDSITPSQLLMLPALTDAPLILSSLQVIIPLPPDSGPYTSVECSCFIVTISAPGLLKTEVILPYAVSWKLCSAVYDCEKGVLVVALPLMRGKGVEETCDVGSKMWGLSEALSAGDDDDVREKKEKKEEEVTDENKLPEDKFHLNIPKGYNQYSGLKQDEDLEDDPNENTTGELPEDKFHRQDIMSQHIIDQQNEERKKKVDNADRDRKQRNDAKKNGNGDDDVEYLDVDDFKPGGKYYHGKDKISESDEPDNKDLYLLRNKDLTKAREVMMRNNGGEEEEEEDNDIEIVETPGAKAKTVEEGDGGSQYGGEVKDKVKDKVKRKVVLKSSMWTELID